MSDEKHIELTQKIALQERTINALTNTVKIKTKCISLLSHEFKGLLANLHWLTEMKELGISNDIFEEILPELKTKVNSSLSILQSTLEWIKTQGETYKLKPASISSVNLFQELINFYSNGLKTKQLNLVFKGDNGLLIETDLVILKFVLKKVIENAIKFSFPENNISIEFHKGQKFISIGIKDFGLGMDIKTLENLFTLDKRLELGTGEEHGLGLSLVYAKEMIELINGSINFTSQKNIGTVVILKIPTL